MPNTTFFDWDAVLYEIESGKFHAIPNYIGRLNSGIVDINLEDNMSQRGCIVRALRMLQQQKASLSPKLSYYVYNNILYHSTNDLLRFDNKNILTSDFIVKITNKLIDHIKNDPNKSFSTI